MDVLQYYGLNEHPFRIGPDPRFLYFSEQVKEAIAKCEYKIRHRIGPVYIYGPVGTGKTSLLRRLYEVLGQDDRYIVVPLVAPNIKTSNAFLRAIMDEFKVKTERSYYQSLKNFEDYLIQQYKEGKVPVLLVDEAQNINTDTLRLIHYLLNFETATVKLLQVVLVGQEELGAKILKFRELASRMFPSSILPLSVEELREMIRFRWMVAGGKDNPFDDEEDSNYKVIHAYSRGLPRDAIKMSDEVLIDLMVKGEKKVSPDQVETIAQSLKLTKQK
jgi:general secretion pathway protein A